MVIFDYSLVYCTVTKDYHFKRTLKSSNPQYLSKKKTDCLYMNGTGFYQANYHKPRLFVCLKYSGFDVMDSRLSSFDSSSETLIRRLTAF